MLDRRGAVLEGVLQDLWFISWLVTWQQFVLFF